MNQIQCAYCGKLINKRSENHRDHVFPDCLYASSSPKSKVQRLTVPCCRECNAAWQDDEVHFRNMLVLAGEPLTQERRDLWESTIRRSFEKEDAKRRLEELFNQMKQIETDEGPRHAVYLAEDKQVMRIVKKIVRGIAYVHGDKTAVPEELVWADILRFRIPEDIVNNMHYHQRDPNRVEYRYFELNSEDIRSVWLLTFFRRLSFVGIVTTNARPAS